MLTPHHYQTQVLQEAKKLFIQSRQQLADDLENKLTTQATFDLVDSILEENIKDIEESLQQLFLIRTSYKITTGTN